MKFAISQTISAKTQSFRCTTLKSKENCILDLISLWKFKNLGFLDASLASNFCSLLRKSLLYTKALYCLVPVTLNFDQTIHSYGWETTTKKEEEVTLKTAGGISSFRLLLDFCQPPCFHLLLFHSIFMAEKLQQIRKERLLWKQLGEIKLSSTARLLSTT